MAPQDLRRAHDAAHVAKNATQLSRLLLRNRQQPRDRPIAMKDRAGALAAAPELPAHRIDDVTLRHALQARSAAVLGYCRAAQFNLEVVARRDPDYFAKLYVMPLFLGCDLWPDV
jgi:hypothetical protein